MLRLDIGKRPVTNRWQTTNGWHCLAVSSPHELSYAYTLRLRNVFRSMRSARPREQIALDVDGTEVGVHHREMGIGGTTRTSVRSSGGEGSSYPLSVFFRSIDRSTGAMLLILGGNL
jgi:hypothetical protein